MKKNQILLFVGAVAIMVGGVGAFFALRHSTANTEPSFTSVSLDDVSVSPSPSVLPMDGLGQLEKGGASFPGGGSPPSENGGQNRNPIGAKPSGDFVTGEITAKSTNLLTISIRNGGSKKVLISSSTTIQVFDSAISKMVTGTLEDLDIGKEIMAVGSINVDGDLVARSIQSGNPQGMPPSPK